MIAKLKKVPRLAFAVVAITAFTMLLVAAAVSLLAVRRSRQLQLTLQLADSAEAAGDWTAAESFLRQSLRSRENDGNLCWRIGRAIEEGAELDGTGDAERAIPFYAKSLRLEPANHDARLRLAGLLVQEQPQEALKHAAIVLAQTSANLQAERIQALAMARLIPQQLGQSKKVAETWTQLLRVSRQLPGDTRVASAVANLGRQHDRTIAAAQGVSVEHVRSMADEALDRLVTHSDDEADARMRRLLHQRRYAHLGEPAVTDIHETAGAEHLADGDKSQGDPLESDIRQDVERLLELRPTSSVVKLLAAGLETRAAFSQPPWSNPVGTVDQNAVERALNHLVDATQQRRSDPASFLSLAQMQWWIGQREQATQTLARGRELHDDGREILSLRLAETALAIGHWQLADTALRDLESMSDGEEQSALPMEIEFAADMLRVQWLLARGNPDGDPKRVLTKLVRYGESLQPGGMRALRFYLMGLCQAHLGNWPNAEQMFDEAARASDASVLPRLAAASAISRQGRYREATMAYRQALALQKRTGESINVNQVQVEIARCQLAEQDGRPTAQQQWRAFSKTLDSLLRELPNSPIPWYLELVSVETGRPVTEGRDATFLVELGVSRFSEHEGFWPLLARYHLQAGDQVAAAKAIEKAEKQAGRPSLALRLDQAVSRREFDKAEQLLAKLAERSPAHQQANYIVRRATLLARAGRDKQAEALLRDWTRDHAPDARIHYQLAQLAWRRGEVESVEQANRTLAKSDSKDAIDQSICRAQSLLLHHLKTRDDRFEIELRQVAKELANDYPFNRRARVLEGVIAQHLGDTRQAVRALRTAVECGERSVAVVLRLASLLLESRQYEESLEYCLLAAQRDEGCGAASLAARIVTLGNTGQNGQSRVETLFIDNLERKSCRDYGLFLMNLAVLREHQNRPQDAIELTREALEVHRGSIALKNNLAWFLAAYEGQHEAAGRLIDEAIDAAGELPTLLDTKGVILLSGGKHVAAVEVLEKSLRTKTVPPGRYLHLAQAYLQTGRTEDAERMLQCAEDGDLLQLTPWDRNVLLRLKATLP